MQINLFQLTLFSFSILLTSSQQLSSVFLLPFASTVPMIQCSKPEYVKVINFTRSPYMLPFSCPSSSQRLPVAIDGKLISNEQATYTTNSDCFISFPFSCFPDFLVFFFHGPLDSSVWGIPQVKFVQPLKRLASIVTLPVAIETANLFESFNTQA